MIRRANIETLGPFVKVFFDRMQTPAETDALVVLRQQGTDEDMATLTWSNTQCMLAVRNTNGRTRSLPVSLQEREALRNRIQLDTLMSSGAVFVDDVLDGESYLVRQVKAGKVTESLLGNPRLCDSEELKALAKGLDSFLSIASSMAAKRAGPSSP